MSRAYLSSQTLTVRAQKLLRIGSQEERRGLPRDHQHRLGRHALCEIEARKGSGELDIDTIAM
jgi:hypothetical protein